MSNLSDYMRDDDDLPPSPPKVNQRLGHYPLSEKYYETFSEKVPDDIVEDDSCCMSFRCFLRLVGMFLTAAVIIAIVVLCITYIPKLNKKKHKEIIVPQPVHNYTIAFQQNLKYFSAQMSGKLPPGFNISWRGDSALQDGSDAFDGIDLSGGYYDAGDQVKFTFPQAYAITMLSWSYLKNFDEYVARNSTVDMINTIQWGTNWLMKCHVTPGVLCAQVGDAVENHKCWQRPEDMSTPRTSYFINPQDPGTDLAGEVAAAFAASAMVFKTLPGGKGLKYATDLLTRAQQLWTVATGMKDQAVYSLNLLEARGFYNSTGYEDELLWAASWLYLATKNVTYLNYATDDDRVSFFKNRTATRFGWDQKLPGALVLLAGLNMNVSQPLPSPTYLPKILAYTTMAETFLCSHFPFASNALNQTTPAGLLYLSSEKPLQYAGASAFLAFTYSDFLGNRTKQMLNCGNYTGVNATGLRTWAKSQVDYMLGTNPTNTSFMVGFGEKFPMFVHHRGASMPSYPANPAVSWDCDNGYIWFYQVQPNVNNITGAIVGGPDKGDKYLDTRTNFKGNEPTLVTNAIWQGVLAAFSSDPFGVFQKTK